MIKDLDPDFWYCYINSCHDRFLPDHGIFDIIEDKEWEEKAPKEIQELERRQPEEGEYSFEISAVKADGRYGMIINVILDSGLDCTKDISGEIKRSLSRKTAEVISRETGCDVYDEHEPLQEYAIFVPADKWSLFAKVMLISSYMISLRLKRWERKEGPLNNFVAEQRKEKQHAELDRIFSDSRNSFFNAVSPSRHKKRRGPRYN